MFLAPSLREFINSLSNPDTLIATVRVGVKARQQSVVKMRLAGSRKADVNLANQLGLFAETPDGYISHDLDDFNPQSGMCSLELVNEAPHRACYPHTGSVLRYEQFHGVPYRR